MTRCSFGSTKNEVTVYKLFNLSVEVDRNYAGWNYNIIQGSGEDQNFNRRWKLYVQRNMS